MALDDALGGAIDPQQAINTYNASTAPDITDQGQITDPNVLVGRQIRSFLNWNTQRQQALQAAQQPQPVHDFSDFGDPVQTQSFSDFGDDVAHPQSPDQQPKVPETADQPVPWSDLPSVGAKSLARGVTETTGETAGYLGKFYQAARDKYPNIAKAFDYATAVGSYGGGPVASISAIANATASHPQSLIDADNAIKKFNEEQLPLTPQEQKTITGQMFKSVGAMAPMVLLGSTDPAAAVGLGATQFGILSAGSRYEDAISRGSTPEQAAVAAGMDGLVGAAGAALPLGVILKPVTRNPGLQAYLAAKLNQAIKSGATFAGIGEIQQWLGSVVANEFYDPDRAKDSPMYKDTYQKGLDAGLGPDVAAKYAREATVPEGYSVEARRVASEFGAGALLGVLHPAELNQPTPPTQAALPPPWPGGAGPAAGTTGAAGGGPPQPGLPGPPGAVGGRGRASMETVLQHYGYSPDELLKMNQADLMKAINAEDALRRFGMPDDQLRNMSVEDTFAANDAAIRLGAGNANAPFTPEQQAEAATAAKREAPIDIKTGEDVVNAATRASQDHTPAQGEAANVQLGHATWRDLSLRFEAQAGGLRKGLTPDGAPWQQKVGAALGYISGVPPAADGQAPDFYMGPHPANDTVYVMDEMDPKTGEYRQSKSFIGFSTPRDAVGAYLNTGDKSQEMIGGIQAFSYDQFKELAQSGGLSDPVSDQVKQKMNEAFSLKPSETPPDDVYNQAKEIVLRDGKPSISYLQRTMQLGYSKAAALMDRLEKEGVVGPANQAGKREILHPTGEALAEHVKAVEDAIRASGEDPHELPPVDIQMAAEAHAEGIPLSAALKVALIRRLVERGALTPEAVREVMNAAGASEEADAILAGISTSGNELPAQAPGARPGGTPTSLADALAEGGVQAGPEATEGGTQAAQSVQAGAVAGAGGEPGPGAVTAAPGAGEPGAVVPHPVTEPNVPSGAEAGREPSGTAVPSGGRPAEAVGPAGTAELNERRAGAGGEGANAVRTEPQQEVQPPDIAANIVKPHVQAGMELTGWMLQNKIPQASVNTETYEQAIDYVMRGADPRMAFEYALRNDDLRRPGGLTFDHLQDLKVGAEYGVPEPGAAQAGGAEAPAAGPARPEGAEAGTPAERGEPSGPEPHPSAEAAPHVGGPSGEGPGPVSEGQPVERERPGEPAGGPEPVAAAHGEPGRPAPSGKPAGEPAEPGGPRRGVAAQPELEIPEFLDRRPAEKRPPPKPVEEAAAPVAAEERRPSTVQEWYEAYKAKYGKEPITSYREARPIVAQGDKTVDEILADLHERRGEPGLVIARAAPKPEAPVETEADKGSLTEKFLDILYDDKGFDSFGSARKLAKGAGFGDDPSQVSAALQLAAGRQSKIILKENLSTPETFDRMLDLYARMPQMETNANNAEPPPLAYALSKIAQVSPRTSVYDPAAGYGALLMQASPDNVVAIDKDPQRVSDLEDHFGYTALQGDTSTALKARPKDGSMDRVMVSVPISSSAIATRALDAMRDGGRAVIVFSGISDTLTDPTNRIGDYQKPEVQKPLANIYDKYNVTDHFTVSGDLTTRMGGGKPLDVLVIEGRGKQGLAAPVINPPRVLTNWNEVKGMVYAKGSKVPAGRPIGDAIVRNAGVGTPAGYAGDIGTPERPAPVVERPERGVGPEPVRPAPVQPAGVEPGAVAGGERAAGGQPAGTGGKAAAKQRKQRLELTNDQRAFDKARVGWNFAGKDTLGRKIATLDEIAKRFEADDPRHQSLADLKAKYEAMPEKAAKAAPAPAAPKKMTAAEGFSAAFKDIFGEDLEPAKPAEPEIKLAKGKKPEPIMSRKALTTPQAPANQEDLIDRIADQSKWKKDIPPFASTEGSYKAGIRDALNRQYDLNRPRVPGREDMEAAYDRGSSAGTEYIHKTEKGEAPVPGGTKALNDPTLVEAARKAGVHLTQSVLDGLEGLDKLFNDPKKLGVGPTFDEETWQKAKPFFIKAARGLGDFVNDMHELGKRLIQVLREAFNWTVDKVRDMKDYLVHFMQEVEQGIIKKEDLLPEAEAKADRNEEMAEKAGPVAEIYQEPEEFREAARKAEREAEGEEDWSFAEEPATAPVAAAPRPVDEFGDEIPPPPPPTRPPPGAATKQGAPEEETKLQVRYVPKSNGLGMGTLVPINMRTATQDALKDLEGRVGNIDDFVEKELGYPKQTPGSNTRPLHVAFGAEQVDALALAIDNLKRGRGFILGDQTGIGKGRVNAGIIRWAIKNKKIPIFVTKDANLYTDMYRDMTNIGLPEFLGHDPRIMITNANALIPLDEKGTKMVQTGAAYRYAATLNATNPDNFNKRADVVFTQYSQMQTLKGKDTARRDFLERMAPKSILILDESHMAGGSGEEQDEDDPLPNRAGLARRLVDLAVDNGNGVMYSSATYAKRPDVMDLYRATDMREAVDRPEDLAKLVSAGGVPMQQIMAGMTAQAGQHIRRERSFAGITYDTPMVDVDKGMYDRFSNALAKINDFSEQLKPLVDQMHARAKIANEGDGVWRFKFNSYMHHPIGQMLLATKAADAVRRAAEAIQNGEKPVLTVANTMGSFLKEFAKGLGIEHGEEMPATFGDVLDRYVERSRIVSEKRNGVKTRRALTDDEMGPMGVMRYEEAKQTVKALYNELKTLPVSPIDYVKNELANKGYKTGEITGRDEYIDYSGDKPIFRSRSSEEKATAGKTATIGKFNTRPDKGGDHAVLLNQSGSTGLSLHASEGFDDKAKRRMIIMQAEPDIATHIQMLGRINRTGQVISPAYTHLVSDVPAEIRPTAVLLKKLGSLNANTTASRESALMASDMPDFMNHIGDIVAANWVSEHEELHRKMGEPLVVSMLGKVSTTDAMSKLTARVPLLTYEDQKDVISELNDGYRALVNQMEAAGENTLEAPTLALDARPLARTEVVPAKTVERPSPFTAPVKIERASVKLLGKPMSTEEIYNKIAEQHGIPTGHDMNHGNALAEWERKGPQARARMQQDEAYKQTLTDYDDYKREILDRLNDDPDRFDKERRRLDAIRDRYVSLRQTMLPGTRIYLRLSNGNQTAIVLRTHKVSKSKNPLALGSWETQFAIADASRLISIPFSRLMPHDTREELKGQLPVLYQPMTDFESYRDTLNRFEYQQSDVREERYIARGNLPAAYNWLNGRGRIINYTDQNGNLRQGIMIPRGFNLNEYYKGKQLPIHDAQGALKWLDTEQTKDLDDAIKFGTWTAIRKMANGNYRIAMIAKEAKYGDLFNDSFLNNYAEGGKMQRKDEDMVGIYNKDNILKALQRMQELGAKFTVSPRGRPTETPVSEGDTSSFMATPFDDEYARRIKNVMATPPDEEGKVPPDWLTDYRRYASDRDLYPTDEPMDPATQRVYTEGLTWRIADETRGMKRADIARMPEMMEASRYLAKIIGGRPADAYRSILDNVMAHHDFYRRAEETKGMLQNAFDRVGEELQDLRDQWDPKNMDRMPNRRPISPETVKYNEALLEQRDRREGRKNLRVVGEEEPLTPSNEFQPVEISPEAEAELERRLAEGPKPPLYGGPELWKEEEDQLATNWGTVNTNRDRLISTLQNWAQHIGGPELRAEFPSVIEAMKAPGWGSGDKSIYPIGHQEGNLIRVAMDHPANVDPLASTLHEAYHYVKKFLATPQEREILRRESERFRPAVKAYLDNWFKDRGSYSDEQFAKISPDEIETVAFQAWAASKARGEEPSGIHIGIRRLWERVLDGFRRLGNALRGLGWKTTSDIWRDTYSGEMAGRPSSYAENMLAQRRGSNEASFMADTNTQEDLADARARAAQQQAYRTAAGQQQGLGGPRAAGPGAGPRAAGAAGGGPGRGGGGGAGAPPPGAAGAPRPPGGPGRGPGGAPRPRYNTRAWHQKVFDWWIRNMQPDRRTPDAFSADPLFAMANAKSAQMKDAAYRMIWGDWKNWNKLSDAVRLRALDDYERFGTSGTMPGFWRRFRAAMDRSYADESRWGSKAYYFDNYAPHIYERPDDAARWFKQRMDSMGPTWFQHHRHWEIIQDAIQQGGLKLKSTNPADLMNMRLAASADMQSRTQLLYNLQNRRLASRYLNPGLARALLSRGWQEINGPDRERWYLAPDVQDLWKNAIEARGLWSREDTVGGAFKTWMAFKNAWVPVKLALSLFHPFHVAHINFSSAMGRAYSELVNNHDPAASFDSLVQGLKFYPKLGRMALQAWAKPEHTWTPDERMNMEMMRDGGFSPQMSEELRSNVMKNLLEGWYKTMRGEASSWDIAKLPFQAIGSVLRHNPLQSIIFEHYIPAVKAAAYLNEARTRLRANPQYMNPMFDAERRVMLRDVAKSVDNRFGEMFYKNLYWNRTFKDAMIGSWLSLGWNLGFVREFGGAISEQGTRHMFSQHPGLQASRDARTKLPFAVAYMTSAAGILGAMSYMLSGDPAEGWDYVFPRIGGKNPDGSPRRITSPFYLREVPMAIQHISERGGNVATGIGDMLWNKMMFEPFTEMWNNRNYYGYNIWDENAPLYKQVYQGVKNWVKDQTPMSITGANRASDTGGTTKDQLMAYAGFAPAPSYVEKSGIQNRISYLYRQHVQPTSRTEEEGEMSEAQVSARHHILLARQNQDPQALTAAIQQARDAGLSPGSIRNVGKMPADVSMYKRLPNADQKAILNQASDEDFLRYIRQANTKVKADPAIRERWHDLFNANQKAPTATPNAFDQRLGAQ
jgi:hypothetical protein